MCVPADELQENDIGEMSYRLDRILLVSGVQRIKLKFFCIEFFRDVGELS